VIFVGLRDQGARLKMVRDNLITALCAGIMGAGGFSFGWINTPETADYKLAKIVAGRDWQTPIRTLPPDTKIRRCVWVWIGGPKALPEVWCPPPKSPEAEESPAVPTS
jgi:hypothetical protein